MQSIRAYLTLSDGTKYEGISFGAHTNVAGEAAFTTGMTGYTESLTDPSYKGQILIFSYPLIGNYGVQPRHTWESGRIQTAGIVVSTYNETPSHWSSKSPLASWLVKENIPAIQIKDTRAIIQRMRDRGAMLATLTFGKSRLEMHDPNSENLAAQVSTKQMYIEGTGKHKIVLVDCGVKRNIQRCLLSRDVTLITVPYNYNPFSANMDFDGLLISNGPGDPKQVTETIRTVRTAIQRKVPTLGICLGNQILALAAGGDTYKLKFGHRGQNQPCSLDGTKKCYLTTQNHGFAVGKIPKGFRAWFTNANDGTNEGIVHEKLPFLSVQFHPEANPGPTDTEWIFDEFIENIKASS